MYEARQPLLKIRELNKSYGELHVLKNVALEVYPGEVVSIIGASGSGKSTFLRCLNVMEMPQSGFMNFENFPLIFVMALVINRINNNFRCYVSR